MFRTKLPPLSQIIFYSGSAVIPILLINGWGNSFSEPKIAGLVVMALIFAIDLVIRIGKGENLVWSPYAVGLFGTALFQVATLWGVSNWGNAQLTLALSFSALVIVIYILNTPINAISLGAALLPALAVLMFASLAMFLFRIVIFSDYSPFGGAVGLKNSLSVFMAQVMPFLLILIERYQRSSGMGNRVRQVFLWAALSLSFWIIIGNRTRSAWWMIAAYLGVSLFMAVRTRHLEWKKICITWFSALVMGLVLLNFIPNALDWRSGSPYTDSLSTMSDWRSSSGRNQLWTVALEMIRTHPWSGVGTGNYSPIWREFIENTTVDPSAFAFLRPDLALFNDHLQMSVENGILGGLWGFLFRLGLPLFYLFMLIRKKQVSSIPEVLLATLCVATALNAFFDYPFQRAETLLNFAVAMALIEKSLPQAPSSFVLGPMRLKAYGLQRFRKLSMATAFAVITFLTLVSLQLAVGLTARKVWRGTGEIQTLKMAMDFWPWDMQWQSSHWFAFVDAGKMEWAEIFSRRRMQAWPRDPESHLIQALHQQAIGDLKGAMDSFRHAIVQVKNGRCYFPGYDLYNSTITHVDFPKAIQVLDEHETAPCRR